MRTTAIAPVSASPVSRPVVRIGSPPTLPLHVVPWLDTDAAKKIWDEERMRSWWCPKTVPGPVRDMLPALIEAHEASLMPCPDDFLAAQLTAQVEAFPNNGRSPEGMEVFIGMAIEDLSEFPADIVVEAMRRHRRVAKFFPTIAELRGHAETLLKEREFRIERMQQLLGKPTPEEHAEQERVRAELKAAEREAAQKARPELRIVDKWWRPLHGVKLTWWYPWLAQVVQAHGFDTVDQWHAQASAEQMFEKDDPAPILLRLQEEHERKTAA